MAESEIERRSAPTRRELGLTQRKIAEHIGVMLGVLDAYEDSMTVPFRHLDRMSATGKEAL